MEEENAMVVRTQEEKFILEEEYLKISTVDGENDYTYCIGERKS
jgi:hypothetical protein